MGFDIAADLLTQILDAGEDSTVNCSALKLREPGLDGVEPRGAGRREVKVEPWVGLQEFPDLVGLMRAAVVENQMQIQVLGGGPVDLAQEVAAMTVGPVQHRGDAEAVIDVWGRSGDQSSAVR